MLKIILVSREETLVKAREIHVYMKIFPISVLIIKSFLLSILLLQAKNKLNKGKCFLINPSIFTLRGLLCHLCPPQCHQQFHYKHQQEVEKQMPAIQTKHFNFFCRALIYSWGTSYKFQTFPNNGLGSHYSICVLQLFDIIFDLQFNNLHFVNSSFKRNACTTHCKIFLKHVLI